MLINFDAKLTKIHYNSINPQILSIHEKPVISAELYGLISKSKPIVVRSEYLSSLMSNPMTIASTCSIGLRLFQHGQQSGDLDTTLSIQSLRLVYNLLTEHLSHNLPSKVC